MCPTTQPVTSRMEIEMLRVSHIIFSSFSLGDMKFSSTAEANFYRVLWVSAGARHEATIPVVPLKMAV